MNETNSQRQIILRNFYGEGKHIYDDELGWTEEMKEESDSVVSREIFFVEVVSRCLNLTFYHLDDDTFYGIHRERYPIECKILPRDRSAKYLGWQCRCNTHDEGIVIASFDDENLIWDNLRIGGKSLEEVLRRSYITGLN